MKHDHHTAPRYYLKAFSIPAEPAFIWEYHRGTPYNPGPPGRRRNPVKRALSKASVKTDYYGKYEDDLALREEQATPIIETLRTTPPGTSRPLLTPEEKATLTDYLGLFMKRTTAREERLPAIWKTVRPQQIINLERAITILMNQGRFSEARERQDEKRTFDTGLPDELRQRSTIEPYERVRARIIDLRWTFLTTSTPVLLTSDNPVRFPEHEGFTHPLAFLTFPISTSMTLFASTAAAADLLQLPTARTDCGSAPTTHDHAAVLNHLTRTGAHQYLYSHEASQTIADHFG